MFVIVGLGNPGTKYEGTKHNVGFAAVEEIAREIGAPITKSKHKALVGEGRIGSEKVVLIKPQTFMNLSGESVRSVLDYYDVPVERMIVIYDDIDTDLGAIRIRKKGSAGTHNGMKSIIQHIKSDEFPRIRIGIGSPPPRIPLADFVLSPFSKDESPVVVDSVMSARNAAIDMITKGVDFAMNSYNGK